jgi:hypothetical protein
MHERVILTQERFDSRFFLCRGKFVVPIILQTLGGFTRVQSRIGIYTQSAGTFVRAERVACSGIFHLSSFAVCVSGHCCYVIYT